MPREYIEHLEWIYNRLIEVHGENKNADYMLKLKGTIDYMKRMPTT